MQLVFKRSFVITILSLFVVTALVGGSKISLGFGSISQLQRNFIDGDLTATDIIDVHNWATGAEARLKLFFINVEGYLLMQQGDIIGITENGLPVYKDDVAQIISGMVGIGFSTKAATATKISFTMGTLLGLNVSPGFGIEFWMGSEDNVYEKERKEEFLKDISLAYRVRVDINFFSRFSLGLYYQVPSSGFSVNNYAWDALVPDWNQGRLGTAFITRVF